jgi:hypothetical protein
MEEVSPCLTASLVCSLSAGPSKGKAAKLYYKLAEVLQMLQFSSPLLHTLVFNLRLDYCGTSFPKVAFSDLVSAINVIRLANFRTLKLSFSCSDPETCHHPE